MGACNSIEFSNQINSPMTIPSKSARTTISTIPTTISHSSTSHSSTPRSKSTSDQNNEKRFCDSCGAKMIVYIQYWKSSQNNSIRKCPFCDQAELLYCSR